MSHEIFTDAWAEAWAQELQASDAYRAAAETWEGSVLLSLKADDTAADRAVFVDLWHGECRGARAAEASDIESADYVIQADLEVWSRVLARELEPIFGLMSGKLKLTRGSLAKLTPYMAASRELVAAASRVDSIFPEGGLS